MTVGKLPENLPDFWLDLREKVKADDRCLGEAVFEQIRRLFIDGYAGSGLLTPLSGLTREYQQEEFLLVVDEQGNTSGTSQSILESYQKTAAKHPEFARWFSEAALTEGSRALLAARWLCHLVGLRHRTVEIFIDPPHIEGHTLVQVRGIDKFEAPGAFDIPCAGHVSGTDTAEEALRKELAEELNLSLDDLSDINQLKRYNSYTGGGENISANNEFRVLYRARLKASAAQQIRFKDGEVAGLAVFSVPELRAIVARFPERIASGLSDSIGFYI